MLGTEPSALQVVDAGTGGCFEHFMRTGRGPWRLAAVAAVPLPIVIAASLRMQPWHAGIIAVHGSHARQLGVPGSCCSVTLRKGRRRAKFCPCRGRSAGPASFG